MHDFPYLTFVGGEVKGVIKIAYIIAKKGQSIPIQGFNPPKILKYLVHQIAQKHPPHLVMYLTGQNGVLPISHKFSSKMPPV